MTLDELIKKVDVYLPGNRFDNDMKTDWLNEIEGKIFDELEVMSFKPSGNEIRFVRRDNEGNYRYVVKTADKLPDSELETANANETDESNDEIVVNDYCNTYGDEIDPLNIGCTCKKKNAFYELVPYKYEEDFEKQLIVPDRFADVYLHYILAKIHQADSEIDNYNNEVLMFNASYNDYASFKIRHYR